MKRLSVLTYVAVTLFTGLVVTVPLVAQEQRQKAHETHYTVEDLGTLGGTYVQANVINNRGWVSGFATLPGDQNDHAFLWRFGSITDLGTLGGPNSIVAYGLSERGQASGFAETSVSDPLGQDFCLFFTHLICRAFIWEADVMTPLPTLGGNNSLAQGMNNRGQVVGQAENSFADPNCQPPQILQFPPVVWNRGEIQQLPTFSGDLDGLAVAINDNGQIVGSSGDCQTLYRHPLLWQKGKMTNLGTLGGTSFNVPLAINNLGQVVGVSSLPGDITYHAFFWQKGLIVDLGTLPGDFSSFAEGINEVGQAVGQSCDVDFNCRAVLWQGSSVVDLNALVDPGSPLYLLAALSINARSEITGFALDTSIGEVRGFVARPSHRFGESESASLAFEIGAMQRIILPENVRKMLRDHQLRLRRFGRLPFSPQ